VWTHVREWASLKTVGSNHQAYEALKRSYKHGTNDMTPTNFFDLPRNAKEDCLLLKDGNIMLNNLNQITDENLSPYLKSDIVSNWLEAVGGPQLQEQVFRVHSRDLKTCTLADIRLRISDNLEVLLAEAENTAQAGRALAQKASIGWTNAKPPSGGRGMPANRRYQTKPVHWQDGRTKPSPPTSQQYKLCHAYNSPTTQSIVQCSYINANDRKAIIRLTSVDNFAKNETEEATSGEDHHESGEDDYKPEEDVQNQVY
jgi:hypothetical protein